MQRQKQISVIMMIAMIFAIMSPLFASDTLHISLLPELQITTLDSGCCCCESDCCCGDSCKGSNDDEECACVVNSVSLSAFVPVSFSQGNEDKSFDILLTTDILYLSNFTGKIYHPPQA